MSPIHRGGSGKKIAGPTWESLTDRLIREAQERGEWETGAWHGRRLPAQDGAYEGELAAAHAILRDAGVGPAWIETDKEARRLLAERDRLLAVAGRTAPGGATAMRARFAGFLDGSTRPCSASRPRRRLPPSSVHASTARPSWRRSSGCSRARETSGADLGAAADGRELFVHRARRLESRQLRTSRPGRAAPDDGGGGSASPDVVPGPRLTPRPCPAPRARRPAPDVAAGPRRTGSRGGGEEWSRAGGYGPGPSSSSASSGRRGWAAVLADRARRLELVGQLRSTLPADLAPRVNSRGEFDDRPDSRGEQERADPNGAAEREPDHEGGHLDRGPRPPDRPAEAAVDPGHKAVVGPAPRSAAR